MSSKGERGKVGYAKPPEPKFIRDLKAKVGYREPDGIEAKMKSLTDKTMCSLAYHTSHKHVKYDNTRSLWRTIHKTQNVKHEQ